MSRDIILEIDIQADHAAVRRAITTADGLRAFWTPDANAEPVVGSEARFGFSGSPAPLRMRVDAIGEDRIDWSCLGDFPNWDGTHVSWELGDGYHAEAATSVLFKHAGWTDAPSDVALGSVAYTWARVLGALKEHAETGQVAPALQ